MKPFIVVIPTTNYLVGISDITVEDPLVSSVICVNNNLEALSISNQYNSFVKSPTGIIEKITGKSSFRVDITNNIDQGNSWQLSMAIAHALYEKKILKFSKKENLILDNNTSVIWSTGKITSNFNIEPISYLEKKINSSLIFFKECINKKIIIHIILSNENKSDFKKICLKNKLLNTSITKNQIKVLYIKSLNNFFDFFKLKYNYQFEKKITILSKFQKKIRYIIALFFIFLLLYLSNNVWLIVKPLITLKEEDNYRVLLTNLSTYRQGGGFERIGAYFFDYFQTLEFEKLKKQVSLNFIHYSNNKFLKDECSKSKVSININCSLTIETTNIGEKKVFLWMLTLHNENNEQLKAKQRKKPNIISGMIPSKETISIEIKESKMPKILFFVYGKKFDYKITNWLLNLSKRKSLLNSTTKRIKTLGYGYIIKKINNVKIIEDIY